MADKNLMNRAWDIFTRSGDEFNSHDYETRKLISRHMEAMKIRTLYQVLDNYQEITTIAWRRKMRDWLESIIDIYEREEKEK